MTSVAITIGLGYLALFLWPVAALITGWRQSGRGFAVVLVVGVILMVFWINFVVGISPFTPAAMMSQVSVLLTGAIAFAFGWLAARWLRRGSRK